MCVVLNGKPLGSTSCQRSWISVKPRESWWKTLPNPSCSAILLPEQCNLRRGSSKLDNHGGGSDERGEIVVVGALLTLRMSFCKPYQIEIFIYMVRIQRSVVIKLIDGWINGYTWIDWWMDSCVYISDSFYSTNHPWKKKTYVTQVEMVERYVANGSVPLHD